MEQGSSIWLEKRKSMITATDSGVILGLNPWKTSLMLYEEKMGLRELQAVNDKMREGSLLESQALEFWNKKLDSDYKPTVLLSMENLFMMASLDGMNSQGQILEIKCGKASHELAKNHEVAPYYYSQVQKQMYVANTKFVWFFSYRSDEDNIHFTINRDDEFIKNMIEKETEFYRMMMEFTPPPATDRDFIKKDSKEWRLYAEVWKQTKAEIKLLEAKEECLREELIKMCDGQSSQGNGVRISRTISKGRVNFSNIPELKEIDLEKYRGKNIDTWRFTETKD